MSDQLLTAAQLAERWQVPKAHVYRLAREGKLPAVTLGRYRRFRVAAVEDFEREGGTCDPAPQLSESRQLTHPPPPGTPAKTDAEPARRTRT